MFVLFIAGCLFLQRFIENIRNTCSFRQMMISGCFTPLRLICDLFARSSRTHARAEKINKPAPSDVTKMQRNCFILFYLNIYLIIIYIL